MTENGCALPQAARLELGLALEQVEALRGGLAAAAAAVEPEIDALPARARPSARNLVHYLALRTHDLEGLQRILAGNGFSSLGRAEAHVLASVDAVLGLLRCVLGACPPGLQAGLPAVGFEEGEQLRRTHADVLFGPGPEGRTVRIMATAPAEAAEDPALLEALLSAGMDCLRINCAHGGPPQWAAMLDHLRRASDALGRPCRVLMDLPGPRVRTGALEPGPPVTRIRPWRDEEGRVVRPATVWLTPPGATPPPGGDAALPVPAELLAELRPGDRLRFRDARRARRRLDVVETRAGAARALLFRTAYLRTGTRLRLRGRGEGEVGELPRAARRIPLAPGDGLLLTRDQAPGRPAPLDGSGAAAGPARIPCSPPEALLRIRTGDRVLLDEGRIAGRVERLDEAGVHVRVTRTAPRARLGAEKGLNFPDSELDLPALTADDRRILPFVCEHADVVGYSFARSAEDVRQLLAALADQPRQPPGIILKIETPGAFQELPRMLLEALRHPAAGVMIARGDLAVESGFERLAELQEEILCLCEAAHVPVVWATQVLEQLAHEGLPSRAEVSDVALAERSEAVMLNRGPYLVDAVAMLDDILSRMSRHQEKKRPLLAHLGVAERFFAAPTAAPGEAVVACGDDAAQRSAGRGEVERRRALHRVRSG